MTSDFLSVPIDSASSERLAAQGLRLDLLDASDIGAVTPWILADARGFHDPAPSTDEIERMSRSVGYRRSTGVWDDSLAEPHVPVATVSSWPAELTVSPERTVDAWAISSVTVSPTHRRRGIARAMLEAELRTAAGLGLPVAMLTVSEATIYGRYGFAPAAMAATWTVDAARTTWSGPTPDGRVQFISADTLRADGPAIFERVRRSTPGDIERWDGLWARLVSVGDTEKAAAQRLVRYDDADGTAQGFAIYRIDENDGTVRTRAVSVRQLTTATDDAYAGLWRFLLEQDLIGQVVAELRAVDEPVAAQLSNRRAARKTDEKDHLWVRILDPIAALTARTYRASGRLLLDIADDLGYATGRLLLTIDEYGAASASWVDDEVESDAGLRLTVADLGSLYLGGVPARELLRAGRIEELAPGCADLVDDAFRSPVAPWLSIVF